jgi:LysM repeat protein
VRVILMTFCLLTAACAPAAPGATPIAITLRPYLTITPSRTASQPTGLVVSQPVALPSPTPFTYAVRSGDTLSQIAEQFRVTLDSLLAANPDVDPNALQVGRSLKIPSSPADPAGEATPTPLPLPVEQIACHRLLDGSVWCFVLVHNDTADRIENVSAAVSLVEPGGKSVAARTTLLPLNILESNHSLPLSVFFPPPVPEGVLPQIQVLTASPVLANDERYLSAQIQGTSAQVALSGLYAQVTGELLLPATSKAASSVRIAAVAYDASGNVVGVRRWEGSAGLAAGGTLPFSFMVSSVAGRIDRVEYAVEARP